LINLECFCFNQTSTIPQIPKISELMLFAMSRIKKMDCKIQEQSNNFISIDLKITCTITIKVYFFITYKILTQAHGTIFKIRYIWIIFNHFYFIPHIIIRIKNGVRSIIKTLKLISASLHTYSRKTKKTTTKYIPFFLYTLDLMTK